MKLSALTVFAGLLLNFSIAKADTAPACDFFFTTQNLCASFQWLNEPAHNAAGSFRLSFWDKDQGSVEAPVLVAPAAASVGVKLFMSSMGHGGGLVSVAATRDEQGEAVTGQFDATQVRFVMAGPWEIIVQLKDAAGAVKDSAQISYRAH